MDVSAALEDLEAAAKPKRIELIVEKWPGVVALLEAWVGKKAAGIEIPVRDVATILTKHSGHEITEHMVRGWLERRHPELVRRRGPR